MRRTVEVRAPTPNAAARAGFAWMKENHLLPEHFGPMVKVEMLSSTMIALPSQLRRASPAKPRLRECRDAVLRSPGAARLATSPNQAQRHQEAPYARGETARPRCMTVLLG